MQTLFFALSKRLVFICRFFSIFKDFFSFLSKKNGKQKQTFARRCLRSVNAGISKLLKFFIIMIQHKYLKFENTNLYLLKKGTDVFVFHSIPFLMKHFITGYSAKYLNNKICTNLVVSFKKEKLIVAKILNPDNFINISLFIKLMNDLDYYFYGDDRKPFWEEFPEYIKYFQTQTQNTQNDESNSSRKP